MLSNVEIGSSDKGWALLYAAAGIYMSAASV